MAFTSSFIKRSRMKIMRFDVPLKSLPKCLNQAALEMVRIPGDHNPTSRFYIRQRPIDPSVTDVKCACHRRDQTDPMIERHEFLDRNELAGPFDRDRMNGFLLAKLHDVIRQAKRFAELPVRQCASLSSTNGRDFKSASCTRFLLRSGCSAGITEAPMPSRLEVFESPAPKR